MTAIIHLDDNIDTLHDLWFHCYVHFKGIVVLSYSRPAKVLQLIEMLSPPYPFLFAGKLNMQHFNSVELVRRMELSFTRQNLGLPFSIYLYTGLPDFNHVDTYISKEIRKNAGKNLSASGKH